VATGIVLGGVLGLAALFLYLDTTTSSTTGASITVLFGSIFVIDRTTAVIAGALGAAVLVMLAPFYRMLLLSSIDADLAASRGVPLRLVGVVYLAATALAVSLAAITIGAVLSTALLVGPAATALRLTKRPLAAILTAVALGLAATWLGILLAYDSFYWPPVGRGWPVSFFIVTLVFLFFVLAGLRRPRRRTASEA